MCVCLCIRGHVWACPAVVAGDVGSWIVSGGLGSDTIHIHLPISYNVRFPASYPFLFPLAPKVKS